MYQQCTVAIVSFFTFDYNPTQSAHWLFLLTVSCMLIILNIRMIRIVHWLLISIAMINSKKANKKTLHLMERKSFSGENFTQNGLKITLFWWKFTDFFENISTDFNLILFDDELINKSILFFQYNREKRSWYLRIERGVLYPMHHGD